MWWWSFKSPTNKKYALTFSACTAAIDVSKQLKSGHLGQGCGKDWTHKSSVSHNKHSKSAFRNIHTRIWIGEILHNHLVRLQLSHRPEASCPSTTRQGATESGNQKLRHVMHIWEQSLWAQLHVILRCNHDQVTKVNAICLWQKYRQQGQGPVVQGESPDPETGASCKHEK